MRDLYFTNVSETLRLYHIGDADWRGCRRQLRLLKNRTAILARREIWKVGLR